MGVRAASSNDRFKNVAAAATAWARRAREAVREVDREALMERLKREAREAFDELVQGRKREVLRQSLKGEAGPEASGEAAAGDAAHKALLVVEQEEPWEKLRQRLREAPIIQEILRGAKKLRETKVGQAADKVGTSIRDRVEDAREFWETSQNPLVYQASSIVDAVTAENEYAAATRELRRLDPAFSLEEWRNAVSHDLVPNVVNAFVDGNTTALKPWLSEGLFSRIAHEIRLRKQEGLRYDDARVLDCESAEILAVQLDDNHASPTFVVQFMTQQINCIRNREGDVIEGAPDDIRAYFYVMAFQRHLVQDHLTWKIIDFQIGGGDKYY
ncbi:hypothetical protein CTAYLR_003302 [Chrysophaeum taylorii]|uniref:Tim44-like domain-containing protein n=1 Tax=Chrysophaeum taylorii TaxID=2483200 RepID=A0AAD7UGD3_9STRA|nr:hypothetical protein CTAYLR_003302 [Chrysophaeum taylorii]